MAFIKPTLEEIKNSINTNDLMDSLIENFIDSNSNVVATYNISDSEKKRYAWSLTITDVKFDGIRRQSVGDVQVEKDYSMERSGIITEMSELSTRYSFLGEQIPVPSFGWYTSTKDTRIFTADDFTGPNGKIGISTTSLTFTPFTGAARYFAIATTRLIDELKIGGELDQLSEFMRQADTLTIEGATFFV